MLIIMVDAGAGITKSQQDEAILWKNRGNALFEKGKYESALSCYNKGLEIEPYNPNLWNNKGFCLFKLGRKEEAQKCRERKQILENPPVENKSPLNEEKPNIEETPIIVASTPIPQIPQNIEELSDQITSPETIEEDIKLPLAINPVENSPITANIHGISGSTQYLINGLKPINGKKLTTFEEINHFYENYENILAETEIKARRQQDEILSNLNNEETRLDALLKEGITRRTLEVDGNIRNLENKIDNSNFLARFGYQLQYWIEISLRPHKINSQFYGLSKELEKVRSRKENLHYFKEKNIQSEVNKVIDSYDFLNRNKSFLIGAHGEELVIGILSQLSEEYHVLNDVNLNFYPAIYWRERDSYIKTCQIDHIVIGPTGVFLLETKNWKKTDIDMKSDDLIFQVRRSSYALWKYLIQYYRRIEMPKVWNVIVSTHGSNSSQKLSQYIDIITPHQLSRYITKREITLSEDAITELLKIIP